MLKHLPAAPVLASKSRCLVRPCEGVVRRSSFIRALAFLHRSELRSMDKSAAASARRPDVDAGALQRVAGTEIEAPRALRRSNRLARVLPPERNAWAGMGVAVQDEVALPEGAARVENPHHTPSVERLAFFDLSDGEARRLKFDDSAVRHHGVGSVSFITQRNRHFEASSAKLKVPLPTSVPRGHVSRPTIAVDV